MSAVIHKLRYKWRMRHMIMWIECYSVTEPERDHSEWNSGKFAFRGNISCSHDMKYQRYQRSFPLVYISQVFVCLFRRYKYCYAVLFYRGECTNMKNLDSVGKKAMIGWLDDCILYFYESTPNLWEGLLCKLLISLAYIQQCCYDW